MSDPNRSANVVEDSNSRIAPGSKRKHGSSLRAFLSQVGGAAVTIAAGATIVSSAKAATNGGGSQEFAGPQGPVSADSGISGRARAVQAFNNRIQAAQAELSIRIPNEVTNGDEQRFPN